MSGNTTPTLSRPKRESLQYQSTPDGDVRVIVESPCGGGVPADIPKLSNAELSTSSKAHHSRNLSAHFYDATNLSDSPPGDDYSSQKSSANDELQVSSDSDSDKGDNSISNNNSNRNDDINNNSNGGSTHCYPLPQASPTVGQKHRRVFSGGVTNPVVAHRRINSGGNTAVINRGGKSGYRRSPRMSPNTLRMSPSLSSSRHRFSSGHRREDSAGLDMLSAAADVSKQELADAAGVPPPPSHSRRSPPSSGHGSHPYVMSPMSFSSLGSASPSQYAYHHARGGHPPSHNDSKHYHQPPHHYYQPPPPPSYYPAPRGYPMQYAPPKGPPPPTPGHPHINNRRPSPPLSSSAVPRYPPPPPGRHSSGALASEHIEKSEDIYAGSYGEQMPPPPRAGTTTGSQTFVTAISVGDGSRTMRPTPKGVSSAAHHRKMSSFSSSLGALMDDLSPGQGVPVRGRDESAPGFLQTLDDGDRLLQQLSTPVPAAASSASSFSQRVASEALPPPPPPLRGPTADARPDGTVPSSSMETSSSMNSSATEGARTSTRRYMSGGTSKRVRRKCTIEGCTNRVVQGGLCIAHGAKRKQCAHPGCTKNVKKAGLCSTHGPARKRCEHPGCTKVAVQGGKCISHGAKKKLCAISGCSKQAILSGMCKKHHDEHKGKAPGRSSGKRTGGGRKTPGGSSTRQKASIASEDEVCVIIGEEPKPTSESEAPGSVPGHQRGLSIFADMSAVDTIIGGGEVLAAQDDALRGDIDAGSPGKGREIRAGIPSYDVIVAQPQRRMQKPTHQRGLSIFTEESVAETIIQNPDITDTSF